MYRLQLLIVGIKNGDCLDGSVVRDGGTKCHLLNGQAVCV